MRGSIQQRSKGSRRLPYDSPSGTSGRRKQITETLRGAKKDTGKELQVQIVVQDSWNIAQSGAHKLS